MEGNVETLAAKIAHQNGHHGDRRSSKRRHSRHKHMRMMLQRLGIMVFILIVILVSLYYLWFSGSVV